MEKSGIECTFGTGQGETNFAGGIQGDFRGLGGLLMEKTLLGREQEGYLLFERGSWRSYTRSPEKILTEPRVKWVGKDRVVWGNRRELGEMRGH